MNKLEIFYEDLQPFPLNKKIIKKYIKKLIINETMKMGEISIIFCSDNYLLKINKKYLKHDYYTDIVTFDYVDKENISGDLFISVERIIENAKKFNTEFNKELLRVITHGILHLIGYNDKTKKEQTIMREKENQYLSEVEFKEMEL